MDINDSIYATAQVNPDARNRYIDSASYYEIKHRYCRDAISPLRGKENIRAIDFLEILDILSVVDGLEFGRPYTAEELIGETNWAQLSDDRRFEADACICELIRREMVEFSVVSDPCDIPIQYVWDFSLTEIIT